MTGCGRIEVDIAVDGIRVDAGDKPVPFDLADKAMHEPLEHSALVDDASAGALLLNR